MSIWNIFRRAVICVYGSATKSYTGVQFNAVKQLLNEVFYYVILLLSNQPITC